MFYFSNNFFRRASSSLRWERKIPRRISLMHLNATSKQEAERSRRLNLAQIKFLITTAEFFLRRVAESFATQAVNSLLLLSSFNKEFHFVLPQFIFPLLARLTWAPQTAQCGEEEIKSQLTDDQDAKSNFGARPNSLNDSTRLRRAWCGSFGLFLFFFSSLI